MSTHSEGVGSTEHKKDEETFREIKAVLEFTLESAQVGDWDLDLVHDKSRRSPRHDQCFGYNTPILEADWGIDKFIQHVHTEDRERVEKSLRGAIQELLDWSSQFRIVWPDGSVHWLAARGSVYWTSEGKATRMLGIVMDITAQKQVELENARLYAELQQWESSFRLAIDTIPGLTWFCAPDSSVEFLNKQWCAYTGFTQEQGLGNGWINVIHPDDLAGLEVDVRKTIQSASVGEHEARIRRHDGEYRWFLFRYTPLLDSSGTVIRWYGTNTDIEDRKRAEHALRSAELLFRGQVEVLKRTLDALSKEPVPERLLGHVLCTITEQFGAHSSSVWSREHDSDMINFEFAFEDCQVIPKTDARFAGMDLRLPMADIWPWPEVFRTGKPSLIEDIREVPAFPLRNRLLPLGIVTVLLVPMSVSGQLEGAISLRFIQKRTFSAAEIELVQVLANQAMLAMQLTRLSTKSRDSAVLAERNRMARDIHDTLAQGLTGVIVQLEAAEDAISQGLSKEADEHLHRAGELARESLNEARRSVQALRPQALEDNNLCEALDSLFAKMTTGTSLQADFRLLGDPRPLPPEWEDNLLHIGREVLTNALRHARAKHFVAQIVFTPDIVRLDLRDDGSGFDSSRKNGGFGLLGIRERLERMDGQLTIQSTPGEGTAILITVPFTNQSQTSLS